MTDLQAHKTKQRHIGRDGMEQANLHRQNQRQRLRPQQVFPRPHNFCVPVRGDEV